MMTNAFYFIFKTYFILKIFNLLSWLFGDAENRLDKKAKVNFKNYDVTNWTTNNCKIYVVQLIEYNMTNIFFEKSYTKCGKEASRRPF